MGCGYWPTQVRLVCYNSSNGLLTVHSCLAHVISLATEDFMAAITKIAVIESKQSIWDYDPQLEENHIGHGLDVIAMIRTLAIKVSCLLLQLYLFTKLHMPNYYRSRPLRNASKCSKITSLPARLSDRLLFHSTTTHAGVVPMECYPVHGTFERYVITICYYSLFSIYSPHYLQTSLSRFLSRPPTTALVQLPPSALMGR
jgi:hypothetical protein